MATYYPSSTNHQFPNSYLSTQQQQIDSYQESPIPPIDMMYQNQNSTDSSFLELLSTNPQNPSRIENHHSLDDQERNLQYQELSLSLGMQITSSSMDLPSFQYNYLNPHLQDSGDHGSQSNKVENIDYLSFDLVGGVSGVVKDRSTNHGQCSISGYQIPTGVVARIYNSRYLKPSQELLEEVANLHEAIRQIKMNKRNNLHKLGVDRFDEKNSRIDSQSVRSSINGEPLESITSSSGQLSASEKQDLQNKITKLVSLLDEVDRKYREYCQQLRVVEAALDMVAGCGAARSYTTLAHQTISRHFRCLRDAINGQVQATRQSLGDQDDSSDRVLPRLRNVEKQLRQQGSLHPLGVMRHSWRPQRGLPEGSVSLLRAWLFEHFLNPYPKDSEKMMLARQTGLTRSQIANWFINARVRLWKPMVEDMYKEEFRDQEVNGRSSPKAAIDQSWSSEDKEKDLQPKTSSRINDSNPEFVNDMEVNGYVAQRHIDLADQYRFDDPQLLPDFVVE
ncbi:BEL1-like homeodomain protein 7 [Cynara cardunculus var. scolymus]|uniref:BEL1-like homeodomain protein 7 n=1 Tax=Cynara cardunculus var. scolymus TaxID=59895 RepID=UPI000D62BBDC|nr:BEL1-like homeodomain protein 7 [Cynara cardunculus var. scolymus]XP_024973096.1 BEL1-like homeodomain protein 7 [Cynara cardunculus var. scolymus]